ncbi:MAG: uroporphyrinogen decarboxylase family protein [Candidatus Brocadiia bacterium]|nr:uroporphyrinogen decarboxylase family protein [Candidatus Brocadiia bacterium]
MVAGEGHIGESVDELITVAAYWHRAEAYIALAALEAAGIRGFLANENVELYWLGVIKGVELRVAAGDGECANRVLHRQSPPRSGSTDARDSLRERWPTSLFELFHPRGYIVAAWFCIRPPFALGTLRRMEWTREDYLELMIFGRVERQMFVELFGPLVGLEKEWRAQGATQEEIDMVAFDWDYVPVVGAGGNTGLRGRFEERVIEETPEHIIRTDHLGRIVKLCKGMATIPLPLDYPIKGMDDWLGFKPMFEFHEDRIDWDAVETARKARAGGSLVVASIPGAFSTPRALMGGEHVCVSYYEQPELIRDMLDTFRNTSLKVLERVTDRLEIDQLCVHEDLAGKSGPMVGPRQIGEFMRPYFRAVWDLVSARGTRIFQMDTDGNVETVIEDFLDCGLNSIYPMEPAAGMDAVALRREYGTRLAMLGGIDKFALWNGKEEIRRELEYKMQPLMRGGGMVFGLDHRIPNGTPLEDYRYYVDTGREILGLPPRDGVQKGWRRMGL